MPLYNNDSVQMNGDLAVSQSNGNFLNDTNSASGSADGTDLPDLSHLSEEERKIIEAVLERQRAEEKASPIPYKCNTLPLR